MYCCPRSGALLVLWPAVVVIWLEVLDKVDWYEDPEEETPPELPEPVVLVLLDIPATPLALLMLLPPVVGLAPGLAVPEVLPMLLVRLELAPPVLELLIVPLNPIELELPLPPETESGEAPEDEDADDEPVDVDVYWLDIAMGE